MSQLVYKPLEPLTKQEIQERLEKGKEEELALLPLLEHDNPVIRANVALGLAYIARNHKKLDKRIVKPYLLKELRGNQEFEWRIRDAISDINIFMGWNLASKHDID